MPNRTASMLTLGLAEVTGVLEVELVLEEETGARSH